MINPFDLAQLVCDPEPAPVVAEPLDDQYDLHWITGLVDDGLADPEKRDDPAGLLDD